MKIPTYKRQTAFPSQAGAQFLGVQASPAAFGAPGAALQQFGQTIGNEAQRWGGVIEQEHRKGQASKQLTNENIFNEKFAAQRAALLDESPESSLDEAGNQLSARERVNKFERDALDAVSLQAKTIQDKDVRARFINSAHTKIFSAMPQIHQSVRKRFEDHTTSEWYKYRDEAEREIAALSPGDNRNKREALHIARIDYFAAVGGWTEKMRTVEEQKSLERIDLYRYRVAEASTKTAEQVGQLAADLQLNGENKYPNIGIDKLDTLVSGLIQRERMLMERETAEAEADGREADKKIITDRKETADAFGVNISKTRKALQGNQTPKVSMAEWRAQVLTDFTNRKIDERQKDRLIGLIDGKDRVNDWTYYHHIIKDIDDAITDQDLDRIEDEIDGALVPRRIGEQAHQKLTRHLTDRRGKTVQDQQRQKFRKSLERFLAIPQASGIVVLAGGKAEVNRAEGESALQFFAQRIDDGARPAVAYYDALQHFLNLDGREEVALNLIRTSRFADIFGYKPGMDIKKGSLPRFLTSDNLQKARSALTDYALGKNLPSDVHRWDQPPTYGISVSRKEAGELQGARQLSSEQRLTVRELVRMERELEFLESVISGAVALPSPPVDVIPTDNPQEDAVAQEEEDNNFFDRVGGALIRYFGFGDDNDDDDNDNTDLSERGAGQN